MPAGHVAGTGAICVGALLRLIIAGRRAFVGRATGKELGLRTA